MFGFEKPKAEKGETREAKQTTELRKTVSEAVERVVRGALTDAQSVLTKVGDLTKLRTELETLKIEKARKDEDFARRDREIEHKVGLERDRQKQEIGLAKREATLIAQEAALVADRKRFEDQLSFHEKRFTEEVGYLKDMIGQLAERLPTATLELTGTVEKRRGRVAARG